MAIQTKPINELHPFETFECLEQIHTDTTFEDFLTDQQTLHDEDVKGGEMNMARGKKRGQTQKRRKEQTPDQYADL